MEELYFGGKTGSKEMSTAFKEHGCIVIRLYDFEKNEFHRKLRSDLIEARRNAPELKDECKDTMDKLVVGGFGGDGLPSTFHNIPTRTIRAHAWIHFAPTLARIVNNNSWYVQELFDRSRFESAKTKIGGESWHRDSCSAKFKDDKANESRKIVGGWVNMSESRIQKFSFLKGTHNDAPTGKGFDKCKGLEEDYISERHRVLDVPPGYAVFFYQHIIHEIAKGKVKSDSLRLHLGFCLAQSKESLFPDQAKWMMDQGVPRIPSNQIPPMHSANHASFTKLRSTLPTFAEQFNPLCVKEVTIKSGKSKGDKYNTVGWGPGRSFGYSLKELEEMDGSGIKRYREYSKNEKVIMLPVNVKRIKNRESTDKRSRAPKEIREPKKKKVRAQKVVNKKKPKKKRTKTKE